MRKPASTADQAEFISDADLQTHDWRSAAHDLKNLLQVVTGCAEEALTDATDETVRAHLQVILEEARRGATMTLQMLGKQKLRATRNEPLDLSETLSSFLDIGTRLLPANIQVERRIEEADGARVLADAALLKNALLNAIVNARDALPEGGTIVVAHRTEEFSSEASPPSSLRAGRYEVVDIIDDGVGIDRDLHEEVFEPGVTYKGFDKGSGMGMGLMRDFARQTGGELLLESQPGKGTKLSFFLPAVR